MISIQPYPPSSLLLQWLGLWKCFFLCSTPVMQMRFCACNVNKFGKITIVLRKTHTQSCQLCYRDYFCSPRSWSALSKLHSCYMCMFKVWRKRGKDKGRQKGLLTSGHWQLLTQSHKYLCPQFTELQIFFSVPAYRHLFTFSGGNSEN